MMYAGGMSDEARAARKNRSLLKTEGTGWDIGAAVRFLAGDEARWMTGMALNQPSSSNPETDYCLTGVILPVDAGATCATGSEVPKSASINPPK